MAGKGDDYRPCNWEKYSKNYDAIFGRKNEKEYKESVERSPTQTGKVGKKEGKRLTRERKR